MGICELRGAMSGVRRSRSMGWGGRVYGRGCPSCEAMVFDRAVGPVVLIAHESEEMSQQLGAVLLEMELSPLWAGQGTVAVHLLRKYRPVAAVLDVGLRNESVFLGYRCYPR